MRTALDTNVLLDVFLPDPHFQPGSKAALDEQLSLGSLVIGEVVYSELAAFFGSKELLDKALGSAGIQFLPSHVEACWRAGGAWKRYRREGGPRQRVIANFLIGAHAEIEADCLLTRDRGFYKKYFSHLKLIAP